MKTASRNRLCLGPVRSVNIVSRSLLITIGFRMYPRKLGPMCLGLGMADGSQVGGRWPHCNEVDGTHGTLCANKERDTIVLWEWSAGAR